MIHRSPIYSLHKPKRYGFGAAKDKRKYSLLFKHYFILRYSKDYLTLLFVVEVYHTNNWKLSKSAFRLLIILNRSMSIFYSDQPKSSPLKKPEKIGLM